MIFANQNITNTTIKIEMEVDGTVKRVLYVETDLVLDCNESGHDAKALDAIISEVGKYATSNADILDRVVFTGI